MTLIPVFVASSSKFAEVEWLTPYSIQCNTQSDVSCHVVRPEALGMAEEGVTGFTMLRYAVPHWCRQHGYEAAIYLDVDMLVLGDIADLWEYRQEGEWVTLTDGSNEVSVISANYPAPPIRRIRRHHRHMLEGGSVKAIPLKWNCEDCAPDDAQIVHFTSLDTQPWWNAHPNAEAVERYESYCYRYGAELNPSSH